MTPLLLALALVTPDALAQRRYAEPGDMLFDVLAPGGSLDRAALCDLEAHCMVYKPSQCARYRPDVALTAVDETEIRACLHLADHCADMIDCLELEPAKGQPRGAQVVRADGSLDVETLCNFQARCMPESALECAEFLRKNPARPPEVAKLRKCIPLGASCEEAQRCLGAAPSPREGNVSRYLSQRKRAAQVARVGAALNAIVDLLCACRTPDCWAATAERELPGMERVLSQLAPALDARGDWWRLFSDVDVMVTRVVERIERCEKAAHPEPHHGP